MTIRRIDHVNISTARLEETCAFFEDVLGLSRGPRPDFPFPGAWLYAGDKDLVHLVERKDARMASSKAALDHFAFAIDDAGPMIQRLTERNIDHRVTTAPGTGTVQVFLTDPNGVTIELNAKG